MIVKKAFTRTIFRTLTARPAAPVSDWSHIYDGIYKFEDNTLG